MSREKSFWFHLGVSFIKYRQNSTLLSLIKSVSFQFQSRISPLILKYCTSLPHTCVYRFRRSLFKHICWFTSRLWFWSQILCCWNKHPPLEFCFTPSSSPHLENFWIFLNNPQIFAKQPCKDSSANKMTRGTCFTSSHLFNIVTGYLAHPYKHNRKYTGYGY